METREIRCVACESKVMARLTDGAEIYPHRADLSELPFWKCDTCGNFVGCYYKTTNRTHPMGCIPTPELRKARIQLHSLIDPLWKEGKIKRNTLYKRLSDQLGWNYHTAQLRSMDDARAVYRMVLDIRKTL